jgi:ATP-binding cassette subfamily A (ABC1) protein 3
MEEIEAICDSLGIMVNGQLQCIGKIPDLKAKYGDGYCLIIKLKRTIQIDEDFKALNGFIQQNILNASLESKFP